jgi:hypothetical protein
VNGAGPRDEDRERAERLLDDIVEAAERIAGGRAGQQPAAPEEMLWRDAEGNVLTREDGADRYVMVQYERPMMDAVADVICRSGGAVLNVGFGCGLVDRAIQARGVRRHVIVEAHPQVIGWMRDDGWHERPNVEIVHARWEDVPWRDYARAFDGVFFDVFPYRSMGEANRLLWFECVHTILKPRTGVAILYDTGSWPDAQLATFKDGFWRDHVEIGWTSCVVDVPFIVTEWEQRGLGRHEVRIPYFSLTPKRGG